MTKASLNFLSLFSFPSLLVFLWSRFLIFHPLPSFVDRETVRFSPSIQPPVSLFSVSPPRCFRFSLFLPTPLHGFPHKLSSPSPLYNNLIFLSRAPFIFSNDLCFPPCVRSPHFTTRFPPRQARPAIQLNSPIVQRWKKRSRSPSKNRAPRWQNSMGALCTIVGMHQQPSERTYSP